MDVGTHEQLVLLALLAAVAGLLALVPMLRVPYPLLLVLGGLALGFVPGLPHPQLPPDLVLVGSHGRSRLGRLILGSVSQKVLSHVHCSVRIGRCGPKLAPFGTCRPIAREGGRTQPGPCPVRDI